MTHHTDAEREEFEAWARGYGTWEVKRDDDVALGTTGYTDITLTVAWHAVQAARRAPAAPVPQGWKLVPDDANMTDEQAEAGAARQLEEIAVLVRVLVRALRKADPANPRAARALDYLKRHGLQGNPLRAPGG